MSETEVPSPPKVDPPEPGYRPTRAAGVHLGVVVAAFFGLRGLLWATGLRFQDHLVGQLQLIDEPLLAADPFRAFTALHTQPPLWNFYVGAVRRWSPLPDAVSFQLVWVVLDLATVVLLWAILRQLGARRWQATTATVLVASNPLFVLAGSSLRYEPAVTFIVTASVYTFGRYVRSSRTRHLVAFVVLLGVGVATRTLLQYLWLVGGIVAVLVLAHHRHRLRPRLVVAPAVVLLLIGADLGFVHQRFGTWGYSSHVGMNLKRIAITTLPGDRVDELVANGTLSENAPVKPFSPYAAFSTGPCVPASGDPALSEPTKSTGEPNLGYWCFLDLYRQEFDDALAAIRAEPGNYLRSVGQATMLFASWPIDFDDTGTASTRTLEGIYEPLLLPVRVGYSFGGHDPQGVARVFQAGLGSLPLLLTVVAALAYALGRGVTATMRLLRGRSRPEDPVLVWIAFTVASVTAAGVLFDIYENARFRQALDPILLGPWFVGVLIVATRIVTHVRARVGDGQPPEVGPPPGRNARNPRRAASNTPT